MVHFKTIFKEIVFIVINIIQNVVCYGKESADFIHNLCQTKFNDWLGLFYTNSCNWGLIHMKKKKKKSNSNLILLHVDVNPLTPMSDQDRIFPDNINTISIR